MSRRRRVIIIEEGVAGQIQQMSEESLTGPDAEISIIYDDQAVSDTEADAALTAAAAACTG